MQLAVQVTPAGSVQVYPVVATPATGLTAIVVKVLPLTTQLGVPVVNVAVAGLTLIVIETLVPLQAAVPEVAISEKDPAAAPEVFTVTVGVLAFTNVTPVIEAGLVVHTTEFPAALGLIV